MEIKVELRTDDGLAGLSRPSPSESWMAASKERLSPLLCSREHPQSSKGGQFGKHHVDSLPQPNSFFHRALPLPLRPSSWHRYGLPSSAQTFSDVNHSIYRPAKTATQSGDWHSHHWQMDWDPLPKGHRWENPLIGWQ